MLLLSVVCGWSFTLCRVTLLSCGISSHLSFFTSVAFGTSWRLRLETYRTGVRSCMFSQNQRCTQGHRIKLQTLLKLNFNILLRYFIDVHNVVTWGYTNAAANWHQADAQQHTFSYFDIFIFKYCIETGWGSQLVRTGRRLRGIKTWVKMKPVVEFQPLQPSCSVLLCESPSAAAEPPPALRGLHRPPPLGAGSANTQAHKSTWNNCECVWQLLRPTKK